MGNKTPEEQVRQRATQRWQVLVKGDFNQAYTYNTPGFRAVVTEETYRGRTGSAVIWTKAEAIDVNCPEPAKCLAKVRIDFKFLMGRKSGDEMSIFSDETWLLEDGEWWIFQSIKDN